jgi:glycosyltransferase involved in cell wall biosynthesis
MKKVLYIVACGGRGELTDRLTQAGIRIITLPGLGRDIKLGSDVLVFFKLLKIYWRERPDVVHLNSSKIGGLGALAGRLSPIKKIIFTSHGWPFNEDRSDTQKYLIKFTSWITVLLTHLTICIAERERAQISNWKFIGNKIIVIHNGLGNINFRPRAEARATLSTINPFIKPHLEDLWLGTIAELHTNKGLDILIETLHDLNIKYSGLSCVIIGEGGERDHLENLIKAKHLEHLIYLVGHLAEARQYLKAFDFFVLPSRKEGFPYAILEAGAAGLPVIASRVGGIGEVIKDHETGLLVEPKNIASLKAALDEVLSDELLRHRLGNNLKQKVTTDFSLEQMISKTVSLYK